MKNYIKLLLLIVLITCLKGCGKDSNPVESSGRLIGNLTLSDENGEQKNEFVIGQNIELKYTITNISRKKVNYSITGPGIVFKIYKDGVLLKTSTDGISFPYVVRYSSISSGEFIYDKWSFRTTDYNTSAIVFPAGNYSAEASIKYKFSDSLYAIKKADFTISQ